ncbi:MAG: ABC transporter ATP-binding protein [Planctomycetales bacterium]|nr:ABC transporter ATP-binding protein [Planctomycetales bacterium]
MTPNHANKSTSSLQDRDFVIENVSALVDQLGFEADRVRSRAVIRDAFEQSISDTGDLSRSAWHVWLGDALQCLGLRCRTIDCKTEQVVEMAIDGAQIITQSDQKSWLAIARMRRGRLLVLRPDHEEPSEWLSTERLHDTLCDVQGGDSIRCLIVEADPTQATSDTEASKKPLWRLWALLKPEWPDIWIVIVFALVIGLLALATPIAVETLVNTVAFGRLLQPLVVLSLMLLAFLAFSSALRALQAFVAEIVQRRLFARVAADLAYRLPRVQLSAFDGQPGRELANRFFDVVVVQKVTAQLLLDGVSLVLGTVIGMAMLAFYHPWLLGFDVLLLGMLAVIVFVLGRGAVKSSIKESKTKYHMAAWLEDLAGCPTAFRYEGSSRFALERADQLIFDYLTARARHFRILMRQVVFALGTQAIASTLLLGLGGWLVISGQLSLGQLVAAELIVAVIVGSFAKLGKHMESFYDVLASVDKLGALFDLPLERQDGLIGLPSTGSDDIELRNVNCLNAQGQPVLNNFNMTIRAGERIAVTGSSESGKDTLLEVLFGLRTPISGKVVLMGAELRELRPESLRRHVAFVRDIETFEGSISDNVAVGQPRVSTTAIRTALADVGLLDDVLNLPDQMDTQLNNTGHPLSPLQLRRLMLARAFAGKPRLLLLDRSLDSFPDQEAHRLLSWLVRPEHPWRLVLITGRETLVELCDRQVVMNHPANAVESVSPTGEEAGRG